MAANLNCTSVHMTTIPASAAADIGMDNFFVRGQYDPTSGVIRPLNPAVATDDTAPLRVRCVVDNPNGSTLEGFSGDLNPLASGDWSVEVAGPDELSFPVGRQGYLAAHLVLVRDDGIESVCNPFGGISITRAP